jgi:hypothetical protein
MAHKTITAYFTSRENAAKAMKALRSKGYVTSLDVPDTDLPDPDLSVNALMIGFLPDVAHGIFGSDNAERENKDSAYLLVITDEEHSEEEATEIIKKYGGSLL